MIAKTITKQMKRTHQNKFFWENKTELAFRRLKEVLVSAPLMQNFKFSRPFFLQTDASKVGVGAVLSQGKRSTKCVFHQVVKVEKGDVPQ